MGCRLKGAWTHVDDSNTATAFDGDVYSILGGVDYRVHERVLLGISGGYEKGDLDTSFNRGEQESDGFLVAPYVSFEINRTFSVTPMAGTPPWIMTCSAAIQ